jgi:hypothetical protein
MVSVTGNGGGMEHGGVSMVVCGGGGGGGGDIGLWILGGEGGIMGDVYGVDVVGGGRVWGLGCVCSGVLCFEGEGLTIPSTLTSIFRHGRSVDARSHGPNCCSSSLKESLFLNQYGQSLSLCETCPHQ